MAQQNKVSGVATNVYKETGKDGDRTQVFYHSTCVVEFDLKVIKLRTGGWFTATTKTRMNQASNQFGVGYYVQQKAGEWFIDYMGKKTKFEGDSVTLDRLV